MSLTLTPLPHIPDVQPDDDIPTLIEAALTAAHISLQPADILVIAQKIVSKAQNRYVDLNTVTPSPEAIDLAPKVNKDPRLITLILNESQAISRYRPGVLIVRHKLGFISANAGIDRSNVPNQTGQERVLLLPEDPDGDAARWHKYFTHKAGGSVPIIINDSHGRPFRLGTVGVAIGSAGLPALWDRRGEPDLYGYTLEHTEVGLADELAAAASLLMGQAAEGSPVIHIRGYPLPTAPNNPATTLNRPLHMDLYR
ncbi:MAG TPA: coenzyme F420-0:L-glutamate ligase [Anaerolineae bacterium]|nr:coenzyme F420-0:L-glutamate ligase [Anaerolineae bacterium]